MRTLAKRPASGLLALIVGLLVLLPAPTQAGTTRIHDTSDDEPQQTLNIAYVDVLNKRAGVVLNIFFEETTFGDLSIYLQTRKGSRPISVINRHRASGDRTSLYDGGERQRCRRLSVRWDDELDKVRVRVPAWCIKRGDYGPVRTRMIANVGTNSDFLPAIVKNWPWSRFVARG